MNIKKITDSSYDKDRKEVAMKVEPLFIDKITAWALDYDVINYGNFIEVRDSDSDIELSPEELGILTDIAEANGMYYQEVNPDEWGPRYHFGVNV